jgi:hypothetical protein
MGLSCWWCGKLPSPLSSAQLAFLGLRGLRDGGSDAIGLVNQANLTFWTIGSIFFSINTELSVLASIYGVGRATRTHRGRRERYIWAVMGNTACSLTSCLGVSCHFFFFFEQERPRKAWKH